MKRPNVIQFFIFLLCTSCSINRAENSGDSQKNPPSDDPKDEHQVLPLLEGVCSETGVPLQDPTVTGPDSEPPTIAALRFGKDVYFPDEFLTLVMNANDNFSGVSHIAGFELLNESKQNPIGSMHSTNLYSIGDGLLCDQNFKLSKFAEAGVYKLLSFYLYDNAGNSAKYEANMDSGTYEGTSLKIIQIEYKHN